MCADYTTTTERVMAERVMALDERIGADLEKQGYKAMSQMEHERLRVFVQEAGYEVLRKDKVRKTAEYPFDTKNVYSRFAQGGVEIFVERNVSDWRNGFSYLKLPTLKEFEQFKKQYNSLFENSLGYATSYGVGWSGVLFGVAAAATTNFPAGLVVIIMSTVFFLAAPAENRETKRHETQQKMSLMGSLHTVEPRKAILHAFHIPPEEKEEKEEKEKQQKEKEMVVHKKDQTVKVQKHVDGITLEGEDE